MTDLKQTAMKFTGSPFQINQSKPEINISSDSEIVFVSDYFVEDLPNAGAELTTEALIQSSPMSVFKLHSKDIDLRLLEQGHNKFWIFSNFCSIDFSLLPTIIANMNYSLIEFDQKFCKYRSIGKHKAIENKSCDCHEKDHGKLISAFFHGSRGLYWMAESQQKMYFERFPFLQEKASQLVLSSVFDEQTFARCKILRNKYKGKKNNIWIIQKSESWIKGTSDCVEYAEKNNLKYELVSGLSYFQMLEKLAQSAGLIFLPKDGDTCARITCEILMVGGKLICNEHVMQRDEEWFKEALEFNNEDKDIKNYPEGDDPLTKLEQYLFACREFFWNSIKKDMNYSPTLSGYTTSRNILSQGYPWQESISSLLGCCDEVVVVDGNSTDGTFEKLLELAEKEPKLKVHKVELEYDPIKNPRFALNDGKLKAAAKDLCSSDFCIQLDIDEILNEQDYKKYRAIVRDFPKEINLLALPVIEYFGTPDKVRCDINVAKWRLMRNVKSITHGVPVQQRKFDANGNMYSAGSDGCCVIDKNTGEYIQYGTFLGADVELLRRKAQTDEKSRLEFEAWFNEVIDQLPAVYHMSWMNIERKIRVYRDYWQQHWESLFNQSQEDIAENNMFFGKPWSEVSDQEIKDLAVRLAKESGGHIFHQKLDWTQPQTKHIKVKKDLPTVVKDWVEKNKTI